MAAPSPPLLALRGITKTFAGGVRANDGIDLDVHAGEVHALVGENGAGKSTLVKIVYGFVRPDAGEILLEGRPVAIGSPRDARRLGMGMVFQELIQVPALTVVENIALFLPDLPPVLDRRAIARRIEATSTTYGLDVDPSAPIWRLSVGERQRVEIVKLLLGGARILILDEPTRGLAPHEVESLLRILGICAGTATRSSSSRTGSRRSWRAPIGSPSCGRGSSPDRSSARRRPKRRWCR